jgi:hypothetical protein
MLRSLVLGVLVCLATVGFAQDLQFVRTYSEPRLARVTDVKSASVPLDSGYLLIKSGNGPTAELSRYTRDGTELGSVTIFPPYGGTISSTQVIADANGNIFVGYVSDGLATAKVVVVERYGANLTPFGKAIQPVNGNYVSGPVLTSDGSNAYAAFLADQTATIFRVSNNLEIPWTQTLSDIVLVLSTIAVGGVTGAQKVVVGLGFQAPYLVGFDPADGSILFQRNLDNTPGSNPANAVTHIVFSPDGQAYLLTRVANTTQLAELGFMNEINLGNRYFGGVPAALMLGTTKIWYAMNISGGYVVQRADQGNMAVESTGLFLGASVALSTLDEANDRIWQLNFDGGQKSLQIIGATSLADAGNAPLGGEMTDMAALGPGRVVYAGALNGRASHQGNIASDWRLWNTQESIMAPTLQFANQTAVDSDNNLYVLDQGAFRHQLLKYSPAGNLLWKASIVSGPSSVDLQSTLAMGPDNRPVVAYDAISSRSTSVVKFRSDGTVLFDRVVDNSTYLRGLRVGFDNSIFVIANLQIFESFVKKLHPMNGNEVWTVSLVDNAVIDMAITPSGYVLSTGRDVNNANWFNVITPSGAGHWYVNLGASAQGETTVAMQSNGLAAVRALIYDGTNYRFRVLRIDPIRKQILMDSTLQGTSVKPTSAVATSPAGTIYLAQAAASRGLVQFNTAGQIGWVRTLPSGVTRIVQCITDAQNSVYVLAEETYNVPQGGTAKGWYFVKYNTLGNLVSQRRYQAATPGLDGTPSTIAMGRVFDIWVTGTMEVLNQASPNTVLRYLQPVAPTVQGETYQISVGQTFSDTAPGVLRNDSDLNGDPITAQLLSNPEEGTVTLNSNGSFTFTAGPTVDLTVNFKYRVTDSTGRSTIGQCNLQQIP